MFYLRSKNCNHSVVIKANDEWIVDDTKPASPSTVTPGSVVQVNQSECVPDSPVENDVISAFPTAGVGRSNDIIPAFPTPSALQIERLTVELVREIELQERNGTIHQLQYSHASDHQE